MSQPFDVNELLGRLMRGEIETPELLEIATSAQAHIERRKAVARRRVIQLNGELTSLRERLEMLQRAYSGASRTPTSVIIEIALIDHQTKVRVAELDRVLTHTPGLHNEALDALAELYEEADNRAAPSDEVKL